MKKQVAQKRHGKTLGTLLNRKVIALWAILAATALFTVAAHGLSSGNAGSRMRAGESNAALPAQQGRIEEVKIRLSTEGFEPAEISRSAGPFMILVENVNLDGEYRLQLKSADGSVLKEVAVQKGSAGWGVDLPIGQYTLTEASHPEWTCRITIQ